MIGLNWLAVLAVCLQKCNGNIMCALFIADHIIHLNYSLTNFIVSCEIQPARTVVFKMTMV